ncbi:hypothetical protein MTO96_009496 [Rhipicephalus appendiculatus]
MGDRTTIVELFEWAWPDVAQECEDFLGPFGYGAVQVSPPSENAFLLYTTPGGVSVRSWYERYEPVSYGIASPSGDLQGVRRHVATATTEPSSTRKPSPIQVCTSAKDFHSHADCGTASGLVEDYSNVVQVRNCKFRGRADLNHMLESVRSRITGYLRQLLSLGVSGFRIDGADYMWPRDLDEIYKRLKEPDQTKVELFDVQPAAYRLMETPSDSESETLSETPSEEPSDTPSETPSETPSQTLSETPSDAPSETTSETPSETPSNTPSDSPSDTPPETPSSTPTEAPTDTQPDSPSDTPSDAPSDAPSDTPAVTAERTTADTETATNVRKRDTTVEQGGETVTPPRLASNFDGPFIYHEMSTLNLRWTEEYESDRSSHKCYFLQDVRQRPEPGARASAEVSAAVHHGSERCR